MASQKTLSPATKAVMIALFQFDLETGTYGRNLAGAAGLAGGTVYPILDNLRDRGILESAMEQIDPVAEGRPARRYWRFSSDGAAQARSLTEELQKQRKLALTRQQNVGRFAWDGV